MNRLLKFLTLATIAATPLYLIRFHIGPIPSTALEVILLATLLVWGIEYIKNDTRPAAPPKAFLILIGAFLAAATISIFVAPDTRGALGIWRAYFIEPILFFFVLQDLLHKKILTSRNIITAFAIPAIALSLYAVFQKLTGIGIPAAWVTERRVTSIFPYPNALALFLAPLIPFFVFQISKNHLARSLFFAGTMLLSLIAIIFAHSTGAILALSGGATIMAITYCRAKKQWKTLITLLVILTALGGGALQSKPLRDELLLNNWSGRVHKIGWSEGFTMLKTRPIAGAGLNGFPVALKPYHKATAIEIFQYPHNIFLNFWSEIGLLGLISFCGLVLWFYIYTFKKLHSNIALLPVITAMAIILIHGLVDVPYFKNDLAVVFWVIFALACTLQPTTHDRSLQ